MAKRKANKNPMRHTPKNKIMWENVKNINEWAKIYQVHISKKLMSNVNRWQSWIQGKEKYICKDAHFTFKKMCMLVMNLPNTKKTTDKNSTVVRDHHNNLSLWQVRIQQAWLIISKIELIYIKLCTLWKLHL